MCRRARVTAVGCGKRQPHPWESPLPSVGRACRAAVGTQGTRPARAPSGWTPPPHPSSQPPSSVVAQRVLGAEPCHVVGLKAEGQRAPKISSRAGTVTPNSIIADRGPASTTSSSGAADRQTSEGATTEAGHSGLRSAAARRRSQIARAGVLRLFRGGAVPRALHGHVKLGGAVVDAEGAAGWTFRVSGTWRGCSLLTTMTPGPCVLR